MSGSTLWIVFIGCQERKKAEDHEDTTCMNSEFDARIVRGTGNVFADLGFVGVKASLMAERAARSIRLELKRQRRENRRERGASRNQGRLKVATFVRFEPIHGS